MANELYHTLELTPTASAEEIRRAYFRLVRRFPPEKEPERFKAIRQAYDTLSDVRARQSYDAMQQHGDEIAQLFSEAEERMGDDRWEEAIPILRRVLVLSPNTDSVLNTLGVCHLHLKQWNEAIRIYSKLTEQSPEVALYWQNFGMAYWEQAGDHEDPQERRMLIFDARQKFQEAHQREPHNAQPCIILSHTYRAEKEFDRAEEWLEKAIGADNRLDMQDFDALFELCLVHLFKGEFHRIERTTARLQSVLPDEEDARQYVAARFAMAASGLAKSRAFREAFFFVSASRRFDPEDADLKGFSEYLLDALVIHEQQGRMVSDSQVSTPVQNLCHFYASRFFGEIEDEDADGVLDPILKTLDQVTNNDMRRSIYRLRTLYPALYDLNKSAFDEVDKIAAGPAQASATSRSGSCFVVTATFGTPHAAEVARFRRFRDQRLRHTLCGRLFLRFYAFWGPLAAAQVTQRPFLRRLLAPLLGWISRWLPD